MKDFMAFLWTGQRGHENIVDVGIHFYGRTAKKWIPQYVSTNFLQIRANNPFDENARLDYT